MLRNKKTITYFLLAFIFILAIFFRFYKLASLPAASHRDEMAFAYNALSILQTGKDEFGLTYPLIFRSFDDYKMPGLIYLNVIAFNFLGISLWSLRFANTLFGSLTILSVYFLVYELFRSKKASLLAAIFLAFSFFHIAGSRNVYEPVTALFFSSSTILFFLKSHKNLFYIVPTALFTFLSVLTYNAPAILLPLLFISIAWIYRKDFFQRDRKHLVFSIILLSLFYLVPFILINKSNLGKSRATIFFSQEIFDKRNSRIYQFVESGVPIPLALRLEKPIIVSSLNFIKNYSTSFSIDYLFLSGDHNYWHNLRTIDFGNVNIFLLPWFLFGIYFLLKKNKTKSEWFLLSYLLISPLASAITADAPITNRLFDFHLSLIIVAAYGVWKFWDNYFEKLLGKLILSLGLSLYLFYFIYFLFHYFFLFNKNLDKVWYSGLIEAIAESEKYQDNYDLIYLDDSIQGSYTYAAFLTQYPAEKFIEETKNQGSAGYNRVSHFGKYSFINPEIIKDETKRILWISPSVPVGFEGDEVFVIKDWEGKPLWYGFAPVYRPQ